MISFKPSHETGIIGLGCFDFFNRFGAEHMTSDGIPMHRPLWDGVYSKVCFEDFFFQRKWVVLRVEEFIVTNE